MLVLAGCTQAQELNIMRDDRRVVVEASSSEKFDYVVKVRNEMAGYYDFDKKEDRVRVANDYLKDQCPGLKVIEERKVITGEYITGSPSITYSLLIKCERR